MTEATERVQTRVSGIALRGDASKIVGTGASGDLTLLADREAERELFRYLARLVDVRIVSEEAGERGRPEARTVAVVDPLDGSSNFAKGIPFYCTSVAVSAGASLSEVDRALIRNLVTGEVYWSEKGKGAFKDGKRISTSAIPRLKEAVLDIDISRSTAEDIVSLAPLIAGSKRQVHYGANALELCLLAEGKFDAFVDWRGEMRMTDFAAGYLIAKEAGALVNFRDASTKEMRHDLRTRISVAASANRKLHSEISRLLPG